MMAADLSMRAAAMLLSGDERGRAVLMGAAATMRADVRYCTDRYRTSLIAAGLCLADENAAVAAIARGEHPADSLPGQVRRYREKAATEETATHSEARAHRCDGEVRALGHVLDLLGCKVPG